jgi:peptidoglycan L-alanyl-D-glutamate endopeptidase CwlK
MSGRGNADGFAVVNDLDRLAPEFRAAVDHAMGIARERELRARVYETFRSPELQALYFARGRTQIPPHETVTNARSNLLSWHGYGLAVDVIHEVKRWDAPESWFAKVAECFRQADCRWGGEWKMRDLPHFQWGLCRPSPSDRARALFQAGGLEAVWSAVGAI